jgi:hypothetical protein
MQTPRQRFLSRLTGLKTDRAPYDLFYRDIGDYLLPWRVKFSEHDKLKRESTDAILDPTGTYALRASAAGMVAAICSPARRWKRLTLSTPGAGESSAAKQYLGAVDSIIDWILLRSGFYGVVAGSTFTDLLGFGQHAMLAEEDMKTIIRWKPLPVGSYWLAANGDGDIDTLYRIWRMSVAQSVGEYGMENCSSLIQDQYRRGQFDVAHTMLQVIEPNRRDTETGFEGMRSNKWGWEGKPIRSISMEISRTDDSATKFLRCGGYEAFPALTPRWGRTSPEDVYGTGPGFMALPDVKQLQTLERRKLQMIEKQAIPSMVGPDIMGGVSQLPGTYTAVPMGQGNATVQPTYVPDHGSVDQVRQEIRGKQMAVREGLYADLWRLLTDDQRAERATAEEIRAKREEKLGLLGPVVTGTEEELLRRVIDQAFLIGERQGLMPEPPPELDGVDFRAEFLSIFGEAQRAQQIPAIERVASFLVGLAQIDPNVLDTLDGDKTAEKYCEYAGLPPDILRSPDGRAALRQARAQKEQLAERAAMSQASAESASKLAGASLEGDNALNRIVSRYGPAVAAQAGANLQPPNGTLQ